MSTASETAVSQYDAATRRLDEVIKVIEDIPAHRLPPEHTRTAARLLADTYELWRSLAAARDALQNTS